MSGQAYDALATTVNGKLDYDVRWQPNEEEPDGFVERVRPLESPLAAIAGGLPGVRGTAPH